MKLYYSGVKVTKSAFFGTRLDFNAGGKILGFANVHLTYGRNKGNFVFGYGASAGVGMSLLGANANLNFGQSYDSYNKALNHLKGSGGPGYGN